MNSVLAEDIQFATSTFALKDDLENSKILITGATGLIGRCLVQFLLSLNNGVHVTIPVRNKEKAVKIFGVKTSNLSIIEDDLIEYTKNIKDKFDYVIHCACPTNGGYMASHPIDLYMFTIESTRSLLKYVMNSGCRGFVYISSLEFYGQIDNGDPIDEKTLGYIDFDNPRNSYPIAKQGAEFICKAYASQYGAPSRIARLTQTLGAGVDSSDNRVFAQFARSIINNQDIVLHTTGESAKPYCYTMDAVSAILYILLKGENGHSYNVANEDSYISIKDLAYYLRDNFNPSINVVVELHPEYQYAPITKLNLKTDRIKSLGWNAKYGLFTMFSRYLLYLAE